MTAPGKFWTDEERERLVRANGGVITATLMDELKDITSARVSAHVIKATAPFTDGAGLPRHVPMAVNAEGFGPVARDDEEQEAMMVCWCGEGRTCWLNMGLRHQEIITLREAARLLNDGGLLIQAGVLLQRAREMEKDFGLDR